MMVFCTDHDPHVEQKFVTLAEQKRVDGIIGLSFSPGIRISEEIPFVSIDRFLGNKKQEQKCKNALEKTN